MNLTSDCTLQRLSHLTHLHLFDCGKPDLNEFLKDDAVNIADTLRGKMDADDFRDYILGLIFYKYP